MNYSKKLLKPLQTLFAVLLLFFVSAASLQAQADITENRKTVDKIVAIVNDHVILKSDIDQQVLEYMMQMRQQGQQNVQFDEDMWYSVLESTVERYVMLDKAEEDSVEITEGQVDQQIDQRIQQVIQQVGSEEALEEQMGKSMVQLRSDLRESYREEMLVQQYQQEKLMDIEITRPEVIEFYNEIPEDSLPTIPEQVAVSQIVVDPPAREDAKQAAYEFAQSLRDSIVNHGVGIEELARRHSDGPAAEDGGKLPMMPLDDLVSSYSAAAAALEPGEISEVVETQFGFHVIRLNERDGDQIDTNHILISVDDESYDEDFAREQLEAIRDSVLNDPDIDFSDMARRHSDDSQTAPSGGRILNEQTVQRLIPLNELDSSLRRIVMTLDEEGDISEPRSFNRGNDSRRAYRIVRLDRRVEEHIANLDQDYERIKNFALQQKQQRMIEEWLADIKEETYIEYKIAIPERYKI